MKRNSHRQSTQNIQKKENPSKKSTNTKKHKQKKRQERLLSSKIDWSYLPNFLKIRTPSTGEDMGHNCLLQYLNGMGYDNVYKDIFGSVVVKCLVPNPSFTLLLDAHFDEICYSVFKIEENGFLRIKSVGGADVAISYGIPVWIHTKQHNQSKLVDGIIGNMSIHIKSDDNEDEKMNWNDLYIDIGVDSKEEASKIVSVGDLVTAKDNCHLIGRNRIAGRALDNHIGCYTLLQILKQLKDHHIVLPYNLLCSFTIQEETNLQGAKHLCHRLEPKPDIAIAIDTDVSTDYPNVDIKEYQIIELGKGSVIAQTRVSFKPLLQLIKHVGRTHHVPLQMSTHAAGDTNYSVMYHAGIPGIFIGIPGRYLHSSITMVDLFDVEDTVMLVYYLLQQLTTIRHTFIPYMSKCNCNTNTVRKNNKHQDTSNALCDLEQTSQDLTHRLQQIIQPKSL